jgi:hypothetical protein
MNVRRARFLGQLLCFAMLLGACSGGATPTPTSTPIPPATLTPTIDPNAPTATRTLLPGVPTEVASWTPFVRPTITDLPTVVGPAILPSPTSGLEPTITPASVASSTPDGQLQLPGTISPLATFGAACSTFARLMPTDVNLFTGQTARITWTPVEGATQYQVVVISPSTRVVYNQLSTETSVSIPTDDFNGLGAFGWEIVPLNGTERLCQSLTGAFSLRLAR